MEILIYAITPAMLVGAWLTGSLIERRHLNKLLLLESGSSDILALTLEDVPEGWHVESSDLVLGNVVISLDYFKRVIAGLKRRRRCAHRNRRLRRRPPARAVRR